jgi:hypothetical protein
VTAVAPDDPRLRFRFYLAGVVVDQEWVDATQPGAQQRVDAIQRRHAGAGDRANARGQLWLAEVYDPAAPPDHAYIRFGTDAALMEHPQPVTIQPRDGAPEWPL